MTPVEETDGVLSRPEYLHHTHGYLCSTTGASKLLSKLPVNQVRVALNECIDYRPNTCTPEPVDCFMASHFATMNVYAATPPVSHSSSRSSRRSFMRDHLILRLLQLCFQRSGSQSLDSDVRPSCARAHAKLNLTSGASRLMELARRNAS
jgi:hypothetical protein